ncbi:MAG TPA: ATP-binding protein [Gemmatimonadales bacterium]|nr:ATP-binding protein [Gemmatimonadales bacterium]
MTLQRKLLLGFSLMVLPALLVGLHAIRTNTREQEALEGLGRRLAQSRTYAEVEDAMFNQTQVVWRYLSGDPAAKKEFPLTEQVVNFWLDRWTAGLPADEVPLADGVRKIELEIRSVADRVFKLYDSGRREAAYVTARQQLVERLQPALAVVNRDIYRKAREFSVQRALVEVEGIVETERRVLWSIIGGALIAGLIASWLISRSLARPLNELRQAMAVVGAGDLDHVIEPRSHDEIGDLARSFAQMTERLRQSHARLIQSEKLASIGQMAAAVAHGLRNPLASLRAAAQLARHRVDAPAAREQLNAIIEQVDRLDLRITHLLAFSRPAPFHPLRESVRVLVEAALGSVAELLRERRVELAVSLSPALPEVRVDPMRLEQTLTEIVSNALDAMPLPEGGRLVIEGRREGNDDGADGVVLTITDSGGGIAPEVLANVCEPFFTTRAEGTGLGLAIAKRYVEETGGRLSITSVVGRGTTVRIWLPSAGDAAPAPALPAAPARQLA